jgi:hypothetical protein
MPDTPVARAGGGSYDPVMERRISGLEEAARDMNSSIGRLEATTARREMTTVEIKAMLGTTLPHLATKADLAEKPSKT